MIDNLPVLSWRGLPDGSKDFFNLRWHDYTGLSPAEAHGSGWPRHSSPDDMQQVRDLFLELVASGKPVEWKHAYGDSTASIGGSSAGRAGARPTGKDRHVIRDTHRYRRPPKAAEDKLRRSEQELRRMIDAIPQTIVVLDPDGNAVNANQSTLDFTGLTIEAVRAPSFRELVFHPDDVERLRSQRQESLARGFRSPLSGACAEDGQYRWFLIQYNPLRDGNERLLHWYATGTDIDDRKRAETKRAK